MSNNAEIIHIQEELNRIWYIDDDNKYYCRYANGEIVEKTEQDVKDFLNKTDIERFNLLFGEG